MSTALRTYYRGDELVGLRDGQANATRYYHFDHQGTTQCLTDKSSAVTDRFASDAWGVEVKRTGSSINRHWYVGDTGYYSAVTTRDDYVRMRYYSPQTARWRSKDVARHILFADQAYTYVVQNPSANTDPSGMTPRKGVAKCRPQDVLCRCNPGASPLCVNKPIDKNSKLGACYVGVCNDVCRVLKDIDNLKEVFCGSGGSPVRWFQCWIYNLNNPQQATGHDANTTCPNFACDTSRPSWADVWRDIRVVGIGQNDPPGWRYAPCCKECESRVCCFRQAPLAAELRAKQGELLLSCWKHFR